MFGESVCLAFFPNLGMPEMIVIGIIALLIFGRRLPEVGRSLGKGIVEFKKGLHETGDEIRDASGFDRDSTRPRREEPKETAPGPSSASRESRTEPHRGDEG